MKTQHNKLLFNKLSITELTEAQSKVIKGGTLTLGCTLCINSSNGPGGTVLQELKIA